MAESNTIPIHQEEPEREQMLTLFQHRTRSHQVKLLEATFKQEEEEVVPPEQQRIQGSPC